MSEPTPDLLDQRGRLARLAIALAAGVAVAVIAGLLAYQLSSPDDLSPLAGQRTRAYRFVFYVAGLAGAIAFVATAALLAWRKRRADEAARLPRARAR